MIKGFSFENYHSVSTVRAVTVSSLNNEHYVVQAMSGAKFYVSVKVKGWLNGLKFNQSVKG